jgi:uncharacterized membrane protein (UPF0127 family)
MRIVVLSFVSVTAAYTRSATQAVCANRSACESAAMAEVVRIKLESGEVVCERCVMATSVALRFRGLMGRAELPAGEGILLRPCGSVHTFFMRFPIDVVFCDRDLRVLGVAAEVPKWRMRSQRGAKVTIELAAGEAARRGIVAGALLRVSPQ